MISVLCQSLLFYDKVIWIFSGNFFSGICFVILTVTFIGFSFRFANLNNPELLWRLTRVLVEKAELAANERDREAYLREVGKIQKSGSNMLA